MYIWMNVSVCVGEYVWIERSIVNKRSIMKYDGMQVH